MSKQTKKEHISSIKNYLEEIRDLGKNEMPDSGIITIVYNIDNKSLESFHNDGAVISTASNGGGDNPGNPFP